jgi:peptidoglycan/xylan/chitin deacetylase (PgdA/CDA1 family)
VALPDEGNRTDDTTVAITAQAAGSEPATDTTDEPTELLPESSAAPQAELTVALPPTPSAPPEDETAAIPAAPPEDKTVAIPAAPPEDKTVAIPAAPPEDKTVAIPAAPPEDKTVAIPAADRTVALPAARSEEKLVAPPEEKTVSLPRGETVAVPAVRPEEPSPPERTVAPPESPGGPLLGRRRLLLTGAGVVVAAVVGGIVVEASGRKPGPAGAQAHSGKPAAVTSTKPREPEKTHATPPPVPVQKKPIFTLPEYRKATGAGPFPADAIALTIDDGPHPVWTPKILHLLDQYHVPAMFCMIGNQVLGHEDVAKMVTSAGHQLANHTWSHPTSLAKKTGGAVLHEILRAQEKIHDTTGRAPKFFRSPGGDWSPTVLRETAAAGLLPLDWTNDPKDWTRPGVNKIEHTMLSAHPGQILLCHDGGGDRSQTYNALKVVLPQLKARGLRFVAL